MGAFRRLYGSHPGHLLAMLVALAFAVYGFTRIWQTGQGTAALVAWFVGALLVNDFVFLPLYLGVYRAARRAAGVDAGARRRVPILNHLLLPAAISSLLFVTWIPLILRLGVLPSITTLSLSPYLPRWLAITGGLFALSGLVYAARAVRARGLPQADIPGEAAEGGQEDQGG